MSLSWLAGSTVCNQDLTEPERIEAAELVEQEDLLTLRKAKALYLLTQRNALPHDF